MWGRKEDQSNGPDMQLGSAQQKAPPREAPPRPVAAPPQPAEPKRSADAAHSSRLGQSIKFKGEIHSDEDFLVDGWVEGSISVPKHSVVFGPKSNVHATVEAKSILIYGQVKGKINASETVELAKTGRFEGDLITRLLEIHDGAVFVGTSAVHEQEPPPAAQPPPRPKKKAEAAPKVPLVKPPPPDRVPAPAIPQRPIVRP